MTGGHRRIVRVALAVLLAASAFSIAGLLLMRFSPAAVARAGSMLPWLIKTPTWLFMAALPAVALFATVGDTAWRRGVVLLLAVSAIGLGAELLGTTSGFPFGEYEYGDVLGAKILGHVPISIPTSWYAASMMCAYLASRVVDALLSRIVLGAAFMMLWDVPLDPAMSYGFPAWTWGGDGVFYGMPLVNLAGWFATSLVIMVVVVPAIHGRARDAGWARVLWVASCLLPVGISLTRGMWLAVLVAVPAIALPLLPRRWWAALRPERGHAASWRTSHVQ